MADTVSTNIILNTDRHLVIQITNISDSTGESGVVKVDKSTYTGPNGLEPGSLVVESISGEVSGMNVTITCDRTTPITIAQLGGLGKVNLNFKCLSSGLQTNTGGATGDIKLTTSNQTIGDTYDLILVLRKKD